MITARGALNGWLSRHEWVGVAAGGAGALGGAAWMGAANQVRSPEEMSSMALLAGVLYLAHLLGRGEPTSR